MFNSILFAIFVFVLNFLLNRLKKNPVWLNCLIALSYVVLTATVIHKYNFDWKTAICCVCAVFIGVFMLLNTDKRWREEYEKSDEYVINLIDKAKIFEDLLNKYEHYSTTYQRLLNRVYPDVCQHEKAYEMAAKLLMLYDNYLIEQIKLKDKELNNLESYALSMWKEEVDKEKEKL